MEENKKELSPTNLQISELIKLHKETSDNFAHSLKLKYLHNGYLNTMVEKKICYTESIFDKSYLFKYLNYYLLRLVELKHYRKARQGKKNFSLGILK